MRFTALLLGLVLSPGLLLADDHNIDFDHHTDFKTLKSFALHEGKVDSARPELNNPLVVKKVGEVIRTSLKAKGLKETSDRPDVLVDYSITGIDFHSGRGGRRGPTVESEATLVIDLVKRDVGTLLWRAVYRDNESNDGKLARKLPGDAKGLFSEYPPRQAGPIEPPLTFVSPETSLKVTSSINYKTAALAALDIIESARKDEAYFGANNHPGLSINLGGLERAARAVSDDSGANRQSTNKKNNAFLDALQSSANYALEISSRGAETVESKTKSRELASKLRALVSSQ
jgi:hypothetical protein